MDKENKKKRNERTTPDQLRFFINYVKKHPQMLSGKNCPTSRKCINELWTDLADGLNAMRGPTRDAAKWKDSLMIWKNQLRCRARKQKVNVLATGGGSFGGAQLSEFDEMALSVLGAEAVSGVDSVMTFGFEEIEEVQNPTETCEKPAATPEKGPENYSVGDVVTIDDCELEIIDNARPRSPQNRKTKKRRMDTMYEKCMDSIQKRNNIEENTLEAIHSLTSATEKIAVAVEKLASSIVVLAKTLNE